MDSPTFCGVKNTLEEIADSCAQYFLDYGVAYSDHTDIHKCVSSGGKILEVLVDNFLNRVGKGSKKKVTDKMKAYAVNKLQGLLLDRPLFLRLKAKYVERQASHTPVACLLGPDKIAKGPVVAQLKVQVEGSQGPQPAKSLQPPEFTVATDFGSVESAQGWIHGHLESFPKLNPFPSKAL